MAPLRIRHIVSFSSQDPNHPAQALLLGERWLCNPSDRSGLMRAELQLEQACRIAYIDIGTIGVGLLQVEVGRSSWPQDTPLVTLLPTTVLLTTAQSKAKHNETLLRMFNSENFTKEVAAEQWDRVRVTCTQPFHKSSPFGVTFISFRTPGDMDKVAEPTQPSCPAASRELVNSKTCEDSVSSQPWLTMPAIRRTFFTPVEKNERVEKLKERLSRLAPKPKSGCVDDKALPRTARLLLTAAAHHSANDSSPPTIKDSTHAAKNSSPAAQGSVSPVGSSRGRELCVRRLSTTAHTPPAVDCSGVKQTTGPRVAAVRRAAVQTPPVVPGKKHRADSQAPGGGPPFHTTPCTPRIVKNCGKCASPDRTADRQEGVGPAVRTLPMEPHRNMKAGPNPNSKRPCPMCDGLFDMDQLLVHAATCGDDAQQTQGPGEMHPVQTPQEGWPQIIYTTSSTSFVVSEPDEPYECPLSGGIDTHQDTIVLSESDGDDGDVQVLWGLSPDGRLLFDDNDDDDDDDDDDNGPRQCEVLTSSITCPICGREFPPRKIEQHASQCVEYPDRLSSP